MPREKLSLMLISFAASSGVALWMSIMAQAAVQMPVVGFMALIPAGLVVFSVSQVMSGRAQQQDVPELYL